MCNQKIEITPKEMNNLKRTEKIFTAHESFNKKTVLISKALNREQ